MKEMLKIDKKEIAATILVGIIILITFLYGSYKIENIVVNEIKLKICYSSLIILYMLEFSISLFFLNN